MKKTALLACMALLAVGLAVGLVSAAERGKMDLKVGDEAYFCGCEGCPCESISHQPGKCSCDKDLVKGKVTAVDEKAGTVTADVGGKTLTYHTTGKFACACSGCPCGMVSQKPGNCSCGKPMTAVTPAASAPAPAAAPATGGYGAPAPAPAPAPQPATGGYGK